MKRFLVIVALSLASSILAQRAAAETKGAQLHHVEILSGGAKSAAGLPMIVAIHGLGDRPENFADLFDGFDRPARIILPQAPMPWGSGFAWMPGRTHPKRARREIRSADRVATLVRSLRKGDDERIIVTGFSQGGIMAFALAARHPNLIKGAIPIAGYLPSPIWPARGSESPPIRAIHGTGDDVLRIGLARRSVRRLQNRGWDATLAEHEGVGHTITVAMQAELFAEIRSFLRPTRGSTR